MFQPSPSLRHLADALRPALELPGKASIDQDLLEFSTGRHRVTSLLFYAATQCDETQTAPEVLDALKNHARSGARKVLRQAATIRRIDLAFRRDNILFKEFKGSPLSTLLYGNAAFRDSKDIDILVEPSQMRDALETFAKLGMTRVGGNPIDPDHAMKLLAFAKEVETFDPHYGTAIELHVRSMKDPPSNWNDVNLLHGPLDLNNPHYVLYLVLHGCASRWSRLKWQADFVRLLKLVEGRVRDDVIQLIHKYHCAAAFAASCEIALTLWPDAPAQPWLDKIAADVSTRHVQALVQSYSEAIHDPGIKPARGSIWRRLEMSPSPPLYSNHSPSRAQALRNRAGAWVMRALLDR